MHLFLQAQSTGTEPATGWALVGYLALLVAVIGSLFLAAYVLYRLGFWFIKTWYGDRLGLTEPTPEEA